MQGHKIDLAPYEYSFTTETIIKGDNGEMKYVPDPETGEFKTEKKKVKVYPGIHLPQMLCNPQLGGNGGQPSPDFDLFEIGVVAKLIENSAEKMGYCIIDEKNYDILLKRVKQIQKSLNYKFFELVRRIHEAEKVELEEKKES